MFSLADNNSSCVVLFQEPKMKNWIRIYDSRNEKFAILGQFIFPKINYNVRVDQIFRSHSLRISVSSFRITIACSDVRLPASLSDNFFRLPFTTVLFITWIKLQASRSSRSFNALALLVFIEIVSILYSTSKDKVMVYLCHSNLKHGFRLKFPIPPQSFSPYLCTLLIIWWVFRLYTNDYLLHK